MARLLILADDGSKRVVQLTDKTVHIGRGPGNDIVLPDAQKGVSRTHAELRFGNGRFTIVDLQSQNGTWLNGVRVERAEVPLNGEISLGTYRLRLRDESDTTDLDDVDDVEVETLGASVSGVKPGRRIEVGVTADLPEIVLVRPPAAPAAPVLKPASGNSGRSLLVGAGVVLVAAVIAWVFIPTGNSKAIGADPPAPAASAPATPQASSAAEAPGAPAAAGSNASATGTDDLQTRYANARAALDGGAYAVAVHGFDAILRDEPGYQDVPQLLVRARAGQRASDVFRAGRKLDAAGDWLGALQKYEQASQIHPDVPGLAEAAKQVREKLRLAGTRAFRQARQLDATGRGTEALREYEKAVQWLPADDPNRTIARQRADQLRKAVH